MTAAHQPSLSVTRSIDVATDPWSVWSALTNPDQLCQWLGEDIDLEIRVGAIGTIGRRSVLVTDVEPGKRVSWLWEVDGVVTTVDVTVIPSETGATVTVDERAVVASLFAGVLRPPLCLAGRSPSGT